MERGGRGELRWAGRGGVAAAAAAAAICTGGAREQAWRDWAAQRRWCPGGPLPGNSRFTRAPVCPLRARQVVSATETIFSNDATLAADPLGACRCAEGGGAGASLAPGGAASAAWLPGTEPTTSPLRAWARLERCAARDVPRAMLAPAPAAPHKLPGAPALRSRWPRPPAAVEATGITEEGITSVLLPHPRATSARATVKVRAAGGRARPLKQGAAAGGARAGLGHLASLVPTCSH